MINLILIIVFLAVTFVALAFYALLRRALVGNADLVSRRLAEITKGDSVRAATMPLITRDDHLSRIPILNRWLQSLQISKRLRQLIEQANLSMTVGELLLSMLILGGLALLFTIKSSNPMLRVCCFFLFGSLPLLYVSHRRRKRLTRFVEQFPDAIDMMTSALQAGHAFGRALQLVATDAPDPIGMEFRKTFEEQNLGLPLRDALMNLTQRIDSVDLKLFVAAVLIQRESGGNLAEILSKIGLTIRARFKLLGQIKVFTAQGRFSGWILGSLPIGVALMISMFNPDYIMLLFREPLGRFMISMAVALQLIGFMIIRKIVHIKIG